MAPPNWARASALRYDMTAASAQTARLGVKVGNGMTIGLLVGALEGFLRCPFQDITGVL
jgi:hypothetical protein